MKRILVVILSFGVCACTSFHPAKVHSSQEEVDAKSISYVQPGDRVRVQTRDGGTQEFRIVSVDANSIAGKRTTIQISDITSIEHRKFSVGKSAGLVLGVIGGITAALAIAVEDAY